MTKQTRKLLLVAMLTLLVVSLLAFAACDFTFGNGGNDGWGKVFTVQTAYAEAQELGYTGSLEDFIASITGKDGTNGVDGVGIKSVDVNIQGNLVVTLTNNIVVDCGSVKGEKGDKGDTGVTPQLKIGADNFWYVSYDNGETWKSLNVKATGADGAQGVKGDKGETGVAGADGAQGVSIVSTAFDSNGNTVITYSDGTTQTLSHTWQEFEVIQKADCTKSGSAIYYCADCGLMRLVTVDALGHDVVRHEAQEATCEQIGWNAYETCSRCDYTTYQEIDQKEHNFVNGVCSGCGKENAYSHTIVFYSSQGSLLREVTQNAIDAFEAKYPGWKVIHVVPGGYDDINDKITSDLQSNLQPDIAYCYSDHVAEYLSSSKVVNINKFINSTQSVTDANGNSVAVGYSASEISDFVSAFYNEGLASNFSDYNSYGYSATDMLTLPFVKSTELMYYNKTALDACGLTPAQTWDELWEQAVVFQNRYPTATFLGCDYESNWFINACKQNGWGYTDVGSSRYLFNGTQQANWLDTLSVYYRNGWVTTPKDYGAYTSGLFVNGVDNGGVVYSIGSSSYASHYKPNATFEWGIAPIPGTKQSDGSVDYSTLFQGPSLVMLSGGYDVYNVDEKQLYTWLFMKELLDPDFQAEFAKAWGHLPSRSSAYETDTYKQFLEGDSLVATAAKVASSTLGNLFSTVAIPNGSDVNNEVGDALYRAMIGEKTGTKALADAYNTCCNGLFDVVDVYDIAGNYYFQYDGRKVFSGEYQLDSWVQWEENTATIVWSVPEPFKDVLKIENNALVVTASENGMGVEICATFTYNGESYTKTYKLTIYQEPVTSVQAALAAAVGTPAKFEATVIEIETEWSDAYGNMSVWVSDDNGTNKILVYRTRTKVVVGDIVAVEAIIGAYNGVNQIPAGTTLIINGHTDIPVTPTPSPTPASTKESFLSSVVTAPLVDTTYKLALWLGTTDQVLYATGEMNGYYLATSTNFTDAADLKLESAEDGYYLNLGGKYVTLNGAWSGTRIRVTISLDETAFTVFAIGDSNELIATVFATDDEGAIQSDTFYIGTYNIYNTISASSTVYIADATKIDDTQFPARIIVNAEVALVETSTDTDNSGSGDSGSETTDPMPSVTVTTIADALAATEGTAVELTGTVSSITTAWNGTYNTMSVNISDGTNEILLYRITTQVEVGNVVSVSGTVRIYNDTVRVKNSTLTIISSGSTGDTDNSGSGYSSSNESGEITTITFAEATELAGTGKNVFTTEKYYITGTISEITNATVGHMYIADDDGNTFYIYGSYDSTGTNRYGSMSNPPQVGDVVVLWGVLGFYTAPQMKNAWIISSSTPEGSSTSSVVAD